MYLQAETYCTDKSGTTRYYEKKKMSVYTYPRYKTVNEVLALCCCLLHRCQGAGIPKCWQAMTTQVYDNFSSAFFFYVDYF